MASPRHPADGLVPSDDVPEEVAGPDVAPAPGSAVELDAQPAEGDERADALEQGIQGVPW